MHANTKADKFLLMQACRCTSSKVAVVVLAHPVTAGSQEGGAVLTATRHSITHALITITITMHEIELNKTVYFLFNYS